MGIRSTLRRYGADGPFADPHEPHGSPVEGWYWRIALPGHDRVVAVMGGVMRGTDPRAATARLLAGLS